MKHHGHNSVRTEAKCNSPAIGEVTYGVNIPGQRYAKTGAGVTTIFHYDKGGQLIAETNPAGATLTEYVHLGDLPVALFR